MDAVGRVGDEKDESVGTGPGGPSREPSPLRGRDRFVLTLIVVLAGLFGALLVQGAYSSLKQKLIDGIYVFRLPGDFGYRDLDFGHPGTATIESAHRSSEVWLTVRDVSDGLASLVVTQHILGLLVHLGIAAGIVFLCVQVLRRRPFVRALSVTLGVTAVGLIVLGSALEVVTIATNQLATAEITGRSTDTPLGTAYSYTFTGVWVVVGLAVAAVAIAFRIAERLQRDTEGLV